MTIGQRIEESRCNFGTMQRYLTQVELGKLSGISAMAICHFEKDRRVPSVKNLIKLCKALGVTSDYLLDI